jgi:peroxisomal 3,2-trans-enoyl-CoA isomerase
MSIKIDYRGKITVITIDNPKKLNALSHDNFFRLAACLREAAASNKTSITLLTGTGLFFSS